MIEVKNLKKTYAKENLNPIYAINNISLIITSGEFVAILGPSGSGKSSLMNILGLLDKADMGEYRLDGQTISSLNDNQLAKVRNKTIGFVFQQYNLLPRTTAIENVQLPLLYANSSDYEAKSYKALEAVGLADRTSHYTHELSGGQQQRVAIARAIVNDPQVLFADEPTGNLDPTAALEIINLFKELNSKGVTIILITHDEEIALKAGRVIRIDNGAIVSDVQNN